MVIDATKLFCADERPVSPFIPASPFDALFGMKKMKGVFKADLSSILDFKAFSQNISVKKPGGLYGQRYSFYGYRPFVDDTAAG